ncbi:MAG: hypothetical protein AB7D39_09780 [Pseudodesulfovibrio sp.]|uniref:hypothetical protein n=1 Tax=Pseudodesulfovibrio sp. TaxID=2035812 RepID=UPI003D124CBA
MIQYTEYGDWVIEAIKLHQGSATILDVAKYIWKQHRKRLELDDEDFYKWQYKMRWAAMVLRKKGIIKPADSSPKGIWVLK